MSMNELFLNNRFPVVTGKPQAQPPKVPNQGTAQTAESTGISFRETLAAMESQREIAFSKHAAQRVAQRGIALTESSLSRLEEGVRLAQSKGLNDTLILVDNTAFLVSVKNHKVITTVNHDELKGNVFTNIDGTVIM